MDLEVIIPLRDPTGVLKKTIESLHAQTNRAFDVLLSDNFSTKGQELIASAIEELQREGIRVRRLQPPRELGRVEHWNWAHHQGEGNWLKPVFVGDWLEPTYIAKLRGAIAAHAECRYIFSNYTYHLTGHPPRTVDNPWSGRFHPAAEMRAMVLRYGMQFGPPSVAAYQRDAFTAVGGYPTGLPICADNLLFCTLAASFGALGLPDRLCHFNIHEARFSTQLPGKRRDTFKETMTYLWMLAYHAWTDNFPFSAAEYARLLLREWRAYRCQH